jgi:hypothetical protein
VCLYFHLQGKPTTLPSDRHNSTEDNIAALAGFIEAQRRQERYGVGTIAQMFMGFQAIRGPGERPWREVLGISPEARLTGGLSVHVWPNWRGGTIPMSLAEAMSGWRRSTRRQSVP